MRERLRLAIVLMIVTASACGPAFEDKTPSPTPSPSGLPTSATAADLQFCLDENNRYRAMVGRPALTRSEQVADFAASAPGAPPGATITAT